MVRTHPVTGKQALFVNEGFTTRIVDVSEKESEALLGFLFAHITKPEFQVRWRWQPNDIAIWDNRVTQHYANADYPATAADNASGDDSWGYSVLSGGGRGNAGLDNPA